MRAIALAILFLAGVQIIALKARACENSPGWNMTTFALFCASLICLIAGW